MNHSELKHFLDKKYLQYNNASFIKDDPISIPHRFTKKQDIEIAAFFASILAWGMRKGIINSCNRLLEAMDNKPYNFIMHVDWNEDPDEFSVFQGFVHRTFNEMDLWHLMNFLKYHYWFLGEESLETAFTKNIDANDITIEKALKEFHNYVFSYDVDANNEKHCRKHIATPAKKSACKKLNMFLRWMVRKDDNKVDFGIWNNIKPQQLVCPLDVHVTRVAKKLGLLNRKQNDWQAAIELTNRLKEFDAKDPIKYDYALFGLGVMEKF